MIAVMQCCTWIPLACSIATRILQTWGTRDCVPPSGRHVALLVYPDGLDVLVALVACLKANVCAVPLQAPEPCKWAAATRRLNCIAKDCGAAVVLTTRALHATLKAAARNHEQQQQRRRGDASSSPSSTSSDWRELAGLRWHETDGSQALECVSGAGTARPAALPPLAEQQRRTAAAAAAQHPLAGVAYLQYAAEPSAAPLRGVMVTHAALRHNAALTASYGAGAQPAGARVSWLPHSDPVGLVAARLAAMCCGGAAALFSPADFYRRPLLWAELMTRYRAVATVAPPRAYERLAAHLNMLSSAAIAKFNFSALRHALALDAANEPRAVPGAVLRSLERCGLQRHVYRHGYALAEHVAMVSYCGRGSSSGGEDDGAAAVLRGRISRGQPRGGVDIRIVDAETLTEVAEGQEGEVWVNSPSICAGYYNQPPASRQAFEARMQGWQDGDPTYLRTGNVGFMREGELFLSGPTQDASDSDSAACHAHEACADVSSPHDLHEAAPALAPSHDGDVLDVEPALHAAAQLQSPPSKQSPPCSTLANNGAPWSSLTVDGPWALGIAHLHVRVLRKAQSGLGHLRTRLGSTGGGGSGGGGDGRQGKLGRRRSMSCPLA
ncbi:AMP-binding enzyme-domain-containing protein [Tribonema minus]|uniref:AMP-binding enzyme-domain-containing protein n=1 Tax=Tribonema minus TaxID=303371 RepID=A0A835ZFH6_9STRA|nr:AMP-binding enzyme-domain-containing protein [Tribonema minus]